MSQPSEGPAPATPATPIARIPVGSPFRLSPHPADSIASQSPRFGRTPGSQSNTPGGRSAATAPEDSPLPRTPCLTPKRQRSPNSHRGFMGSTPVHHPSSKAQTQEGTVNLVYGTDINEAEVKKDFRDFILRFHVGNEEYPHYLHELRRMWEKQVRKECGIKFALNGVHIHEFNAKLYDNLVTFPTEVIPIFDRELWEMSLKELQAEPEDLDACQVKIYGLREKDSKVMRNMNPADIEKLVALQGIVIRCSDLVPDMNRGTFRCTTEGCNNEVKVTLSHWTIEEPTKCGNCGISHSFQIVHNDCNFSDRQILRLQEKPELVPEGETPQSVTVCCYDDLVDSVRPGDRVEVTGIFKASAVQPIRGWRSVSSVYRTYIDAIAITAEQKIRVELDDDGMANMKGYRLSDEKDLDPDVVGEEEVEWNKRIRELAFGIGSGGNRSIVDRLVQSFSPSIYEEDDVKKGLLCQLFGGTPKPTKEGLTGRTRPEINTLLCGDPSTAKSQLLQYAYKLAPRGMFTSGKGSSAVGLTASINKDPATGEIVLESGALVLSDKGICCIDEFDKMDDNARAILHEAMESQTVSVAKAGIVCSLNARTAILATANPKESTYDPKKSVVENLNMPANLMSRFDFLWLILDKRNRNTDRRLASHLVSMYSESGSQQREVAEISADLFRRYVAFAKRWVFPRIDDAAAASLIRHYTELRNQGGSSEIITATPRNLESLIRISESLAKMELREMVTVSDVEEAVRLLKAATYAACVDPETGLIDMEQLVAGVGASRRRRNKELDSLLTEVGAELSKGDAMLTIDQVKAAMNERLGQKTEQLMSDAEFNRALDSAAQDGTVKRSGKQVQFKK